MVFKSCDNPSVFGCKTPLPFLPSVRLEFRKKETIMKTPSQKPSPKAVPYHLSLFCGGGGGAHVGGLHSHSSSPMASCYFLIYVFWTHFRLYKRRLTSRGQSTLMQTSHISVKVAYLSCNNRKKRLIFTHLPLIHKARACQHNNWSPLDF